MAVSAVRTVHAGDQPSYLKGAILAQPGHKRDEVSVARMLYFEVIFVPLAHFFFFN